MKRFKCFGLGKLLTKGIIRFDEPLSKHTTFKIGGPADIWAEPSDSEELKRLFDFSKKEGVPLFVMGGGSNILVKDKGVREIVIHLNSPCFSKVRFHDTSLTAGSGLSLASLVGEAREQGLGGCEFLRGIPGTVGGAVAGNAGTKDFGIGELVKEVTVTDFNGQIHTVKKEKLRFEYRSSNLTGYLILDVTFELRKRNPQRIQQLMNEFLEYKEITQELRKPSAGSVFKNPQTSKMTAGQLIDLSGLKGKRIGDAQVSTKHANFVINVGCAKASDVLSLIESIQKKIEFDHGVWLEPEIRIVGE